MQGADSVSAQLRSGTWHSAPVRFFTNGNVLIAALTVGSYFLVWLLDWPFFIMGPRNGAIFMSVLALLALPLIFIWRRWGLVPMPGSGRRRWLHCAGHLGLLASNLALLGGIVMAFGAASISHEEAYWCGLFLTFHLWPVAGILALLSILAICAGKSAPFGRRDVQNRSGERSL